MIKVIKLLPLALIFFVACNSGSSDATKTQEPADTMLNPVAEPSDKFSGIIFASKIDTSCRMPISAGVEDTVMLGSKTYGFCSAECKADFIALLQKENKR